MEGSARGGHSALYLILCSGTNGYVVRNLSHLRNHETAAERAAQYDQSKPPQHREPDLAILEHERKRLVEVKCFELQVQLEDAECVLSCRGHLR